MSSREFAEWVAYYGLEPFGEERADLRMAVVASLIANANRDPKKRKRPFEPRDFMPQFGQETPEPSPEMMLEKVKLLNAMFGGTTRGHTG